MSEVLDYDNMIVRNLEQIENRMEKFALQNYVSAGGVLLAGFGTDRVPLSLAHVKWAIIALSVVFTVAIFLNAARYHVLWKLHRIARDCWLAGQDKLREAYDAENDVKKYMSMKELPWWTYAPLILINLLPAGAAFWWLR
jgi:hypothetical protein